MAPMRGVGQFWLWALGHLSVEDSAQILGNSQGQGFKEVLPVLFFDFEGIIRNCFGHIFNKQVDWSR
ncbi:hypothetical protein HOLleu_27530 [Holothuria leucospilota]|uniref:Uncharacterized protein n=1 Tax=Holothuria leucospilota TaxID=206669 RepID=A0A9Q1BQW0_HOLLE|nr:hypothetical protein HOLleu_27530 [Holothuria leucospilota]